MYLGSKVFGPQTITSAPNFCRANILDKATRLCRISPTITTFFPSTVPNLSLEDLHLIFQTADNFKEVINRPIKKVPSLRDITIANVFFENSTRTKLSFELAEKRLSADVINFSSTESSVKKGETLLDTVNNILAMKVDMVVIRHSSAGAPHFLSKHIDANIINAGDGTHEHPTQALLDTFSIRERLGTGNCRRKESGDRWRYSA